MKPKLVLGVLLVAFAASAQTSNEAAAVVNAVQLEATRGTNATGFCFLSIQHPEWPPMPTTPDPTLELFRVGVGTYLVDDTTWKYPTPPPVATNEAARKVLANPMGARLNTNYIIAHPEQRDIIKWGGGVDAFPTNTADRKLNAINARRARAICDAVDSILSNITTNATPIAK